MSVQHGHLPATGQPIPTPQAEVRESTPSARSSWLLGALLLALWPLVFSGLSDADALARLATWLRLSPTWPLQIASWCAYLALLITPGYLLAEMLTWRLDLDWLERLAVAFPLGVALLAVPGMVALLLHLTLNELTVGWLITVLPVAIAWLVHVWRRSAPNYAPVRWHWDEKLLAWLLVGAFLYVLPILNLYKIDGDAYAVGTFAADALAGLPLNASEPLFGVDLGPGVRMAFNQSLPMAYLWSSFSSIDPITLTATASRAQVALWILLAIYMLGKTAGSVWFGRAEARRFALFVVALQFLIYLAAPFLRGDHVSLFFFERTTADKFMVPTTMLPVAFALTLRYLSTDQRSAWFTAAAVSLAVSTIHPLIAAMMALALVAFAGFHWLMNLGNSAVFQRSVRVAALALIAMFLPLLQLVLAFGEAPLAPSFPRSIEGWPVGYKMTPALPFLDLPTLDIVGPVPDLAQVAPSDAESTTNPFLIWRFAVNMNRRRLILFDLHRYISDPNIILEPPYILALLLLPFFVWRLRANLAAQFVVSTTLAILFVMFTPWVTPLIGKLVMPWILWRFVWLLPYSLILALALFALCQRLGKRGGDRGTGRPGDWRLETGGRAWGKGWPLAFVVGIGLLLLPLMWKNLQEMRDRAASPYYYPAPAQIFADLRALTERNGAATVLADQNVSVTLPAYVAQANVVAHRTPTTSEIFPANRQVEALQRLSDQARFFRAKYLTKESIEILARYQVGYVITSSGSDLDMQLRSAPRWFRWLRDDHAYSLYQVLSLPEMANVIWGNSALVQRLWPNAEAEYRAALQEDPADQMALLGLAEVAHVQGKFTAAIRLLNEGISKADQPVLHYRLGQIYAEVGQTEQSIAEFTKAQQVAPQVARFNLSLGDACLDAGQIDCAAAQFSKAVANGSYPDQISQQIALADLWRQRGRNDQALPLYAAAVANQPSQDHQLMLASRYLETGRLSQAEALLAEVRRQHPLSSEALTLAATVKLAAGQLDEGVKLYRRAIWLTEIQGQDAVDLRLGLTQRLLENKETAAARLEIAQILAQQPNRAQAYALQGDLLLQEQNPVAATSAYQQAFRLDPTQVGTYLALTSQLRQGDGEPEEMAQLLQRAMQANPDEAALALALGNQLELQGAILAAMDAYRQALDKFELNTLQNQHNAEANRSSRAYAYTRLANVSENVGEIEAAMNYYAAATAAAPDQAWPQVQLGDALRRRGKLGEAEVAYQKALGADPQNAEALGRLSEMATASGNLEQAQTYQRQALEAAVTRALADTANPAATTPQYTPAALVQAFASDETTGNGANVTVNANPNQPDPNQLVLEMVRSGQMSFANNGGARLIHLLAQFYRERNELDRVRQLYQRLLQTGKAQGWTPTQLADYQKALGDAALAQNQTDQAVEAYQQAIALNRWWPQPRMGYARTLADLGQPNAAIQQLREIITFAPGYVDAQVALADALAQQGAHIEAMSIYQQVATTQPGNAHATLALAHALQTAGQWEEAETAYRATIEAHPGNVDGYVGLASLLIHQARLDQAQRMLDKALQLDRNHVEAHIQEGLLAQRQADNAAALAWFNKAATQQVVTPALVNSMVDRLERTGEYTIAVALIQEQLQGQPDDRSLLLTLADLFRRMGNFSQATATLLQIEQRQGESAQVNAIQAEIFLAQGKPRQALAFYRSAIQLAPTVMDYYLRAGELWEAQGDQEQALATWRTGVNRVTNPAPLYAALVRLEIQRSQPEVARRTLAQAMRVASDADEVMIAMGDFLLAEDRQEAVQWYADMLAEHPHDAHLLLALGQLHLRTGNLEEALTALTQATQKQPGNAGYQVILGSALLQAKQWDQALAAFQQALSLDPTLVDVYVSLAQLYAEQQKWDEARAAYEQAMTMAPLDGVAQVQYGAFLHARGETEKALTVLAQAGQIAPTRATLVARAAVYQTLGRNKEAEQDLKSALIKEPGALDVLMALHRYYEAMGDTKQAQAIYAQAVALAPHLKREVEQE